MARSFGDPDAGKGAQPRRWRAAVVGLGMAGGFVAEALRDVAGVDCVAGVDPLGVDARAAAQLDAALYRDVQELEAEGELDLVIVACSTNEHAGAIQQLHGLRPKQIWVEKPRVLDRSSYESLLPVFRDLEVRTLFHRWFAPEVVEAARRISDWCDRHGEIASIRCRFEDPYADDAARSAAVGDCWADSGINALTVLGRLVALGEVEQAVGTLPLRADVVLTMREPGAGTAEISCEWTEQSRTKSTVIRFRDGASVTIEHSGYRYARTAADGTVLEQRVWPFQPAVERYIRMLRTYARRDRGIPAPELDEQLHMLLFDARQRLISA